MSTNSIKSFTLIEVVLAMMLAAIAIGMAYSAFTIFNRLYGSYETKNLMQADLQTFRTVLARDVQRAEIVTIDDRKLNFRPLDLFYFFDRDYVVRITGDTRDTFQMKHLLPGTSFEGIKISSGIVDHIVFRFDYEKAPMLISAVKIYTSETLFNCPDSLWKQ